MAIRTNKHQVLTIPSTTLGSYKVSSKVEWTEVTPQRNINSNGILNVGQFDSPHQVELRDTNNNGLAEVCNGTGTYVRH